MASFDGTILIRKKKIRKYTKTHIPILHFCTGPIFNKGNMYFMVFLHIPNVELIRYVW